MPVTAAPASQPRERRHEAPRCHRSQLSGPQRSNGFLRRRRDGHRRPERVGQEHARRGDPQRPLPPQPGHRRSRAVAPLGPSCRPSVGGPRVHGRGEAVDDREDLHRYLLREHDAQGAGGADSPQRGGRGRDPPSPPGGRGRRRPRHRRTDPRALGPSVGVARNGRSAAGGAGARRRVDGEAARAARSARQWECPRIGDRRFCGSAGPRPRRRLPHRQGEDQGRFGARPGHRGARSGE